MNILQKLNNNGDLEIVRVDSLTVNKTGVVTTRTKAGVSEDCIIKVTLTADINGETKKLGASTNAYTIDRLVEIEDEKVNCLFLYQQRLRVFMDDEIVYVLDSPKKVVYECPSSDFSIDEDTYNMIGLSSDKVVKTSRVVSVED